MDFEQLKQKMVEDEKQKPRAKSALALIDMALEHNGSGAKAAALIVLSLEADNWFKFSAIELVHFDAGYREHANNVLLGVEPSDFSPSNWLKRIDIDVADKVNELMKKWSGLRV
jgi:hypothetical protein